MRLRDHVHPQLILLGQKAKSKVDLLKLLALHVGEVIPEVDAEELFQRLERREAEASTGVGNGIAIPHATVDFLERTICALVQVPEGVEFEAVDKRPVQFLFLLLSPPAELGRHVRLLAEIARIARREEIVGELAHAEDIAKVRELMLLN